MAVHIGKYNTLKIARETSVGLYLTNGDTDVLLPKKYLPKKYNIGDEIEVFIYLDHEHRLTATTLKPYVQRNEFAHLKVNHINKYGAFLNWNLEKDIFCPFAEQAKPMEKDKRYLVYVFLDEKTNRLVASSKINKFLETTNINLQVNDEVEVMVSHISDAGINVIIDNKYMGLAYSNEVFDDTIKPGKKLKAYIKSIRQDNKIDVSFQKLGVESIDYFANVVLQELSANYGYLGLHDNSHPEEIKTVLKMSKKNFKKAIGTLYKSKQITITTSGIQLL